MDSLEQEKLQAMARFNKAQSAKKAIKILLLLSAFSFLPFYPRLRWNAPSSSPHEVLLLLLELLVNCRSCASSREVMFLVFNVILLLLARDCGFIGSSTDERSEEDASGGGAIVVVDESAGVSRQQDGVAVVAAVAAAGDERGGGMGRETGGLVSWEIVAFEEKLEEEAAAGGGIEKGDGGEELMDADELKRKFDDFIANFKRERRKEALQLVLV